MRGQCQLLDKNHQYFQIVSLPTDSVIVDHAVLLFFARDSICNHKYFHTFQSNLNVRTSDLDIRSKFQGLLCYNDC
jgi:hypothetical protein